MFKDRIKNEAKVKDDLSHFYKESDMIQGQDEEGKIIDDKFRRNFIAHKTIDFLIGKGILK